MENEYGNIKVSDDVIAACAAKTALETKGVYSLSSAITDSILRKSPDTRGVKVAQSDEQIMMDIYLVVEYGVNIPSMAWKIQENVKREVEKISGLDVKNVNIHVQGISV
ncbi:MAG: Asp23/Gls24 family envelope stress response protein [Clostridia bacterium]|nr:Asp23/Gls24 family envelope stress response protein [Clostridia bacterium]